jgi:AraC-like DNA-binding protein
MTRAQTQLEGDIFSVVRFDHPPEAPHIDPAQEISDAYSLTFVERGEFSVTIRKESLHFCAGDLLVSVPGLRERYKHPNAYASDICLSLHFEPETGAELFHGRRNGPHRLRDSNRSRYLHYYVCKLVHSPGTPVREDAVLVLAQSLLTNYGGSGHFYKSTQLHWYACRIDTVRELMESHYAEPHSLASLARTAGMSRLHFAHVFRELIGVSAYAYLLGRRLEAARKFLSHGASVTDACFNVGFNNLSHFTRSFHRHFGTAPSRFVARG